MDKSISLHLLFWSLHNVLATAAVKEAQASFLHLFLQLQRCTASCLPTLPSALSVETVKMLLIVPSLFIVIVDIAALSF